MQCCGGTRDITALVEEGVGRCDEFASMSTVVPFQGVHRCGGAQSVEYVGNM